MSQRKAQLNSLVFSLLALVLSFSSVQASDIMGADMSYRCLGNDSFEITTVVYKDCNASWAIPPNTYNLSINGNGCSFGPQSVSPQLISCVDITPICDGYCTKCVATCNAGTTNTGCTFPYGIEKLTFKAIIWLGNTTCCNFHIGYIGNSTRNNYATATCCNSDLFYTYIELNKCVTPCNSSPIFTNDPVGIICANQDFVFNNGALDTLDTDDSLSFELAPAMRGRNLQANYFGSYNYQRPLSFFGFPNQNLNWPAGFRVDPTTGDLLFRPTQANQIAVVVIKVTEWRKINGQWTAISETRRDMQFIIINCPNNSPPVIEGPYVYNACARQQICIDIETKDANPTDSVRISWNGGIRGATFTNSNGTRRLADGKVCWTPTDNDISSIPYTFTIRARDNACPVYGQSIRSFSVFVRETPDADVSTSLLSCGRVALKYTPRKQYTGFQAEWRVSNSQNQTVYLSTNRPNDTIQLPPGKYQATLNYRNSVPCFNVSYDSFTIVDYVQVKLPADTAVCAGNPVDIQSSTSSGQSPYNYKWFDISGGSPQGPISTNTATQVTPTTFKRMVITVEDNTGCTNSDTILVSAAPPPAMNLGPNIQACPLDTVFLNAGTPAGQFTYQWSTGDTTRSIFRNQPGSITLNITDSLGCRNSDTIEINYREVNIHGGSDRTLCTGDTLLLVGNGGDSYQWFNLTGFSNNPLPTPLSDNDSFELILNTTRTLILRGVRQFDTLQCYNLDTITINAQAPPANQLNGLGPFCHTDNVVLLNNAIQPPTVMNGVWTSSSTPAAVTNNFFYPVTAGPGNHALTYEVTDQYGCKSRRSINIQVRQPLGVRLRDTTSVCANESQILLNTLREIPANYNGLRVDWYDANGNNIFNSRLDKTDPLNTRLTLNNGVPEGDYRLTLRIESIVTGCWNADTGVLKVRATPTAEAGTLTPVCWNDGQLNLFTASGASPAGGTWTSGVPIQGGNSFLPRDIGVDKQFTGGQVWFYYTQFLNSCSATDSVRLEVRPVPQLTFTGDTLCIDDESVNLSAYSSPTGPGSVWEGNAVVGTNWDIRSAGKGWHPLRYTFTSSLGCEATVTTEFLVELSPEVDAVVPDDACEGAALNLSATMQESTGLLWWSNGNGLFDNLGLTSQQLQTVYVPTAEDLQRGSVLITVSTMNGGVCPEDLRSYEVKLFPEPKPMISGEPLEGCEPLDVVFRETGQVSSGSFYSWDFSDGPKLEGVDLRSNVQHSFNEMGTYTVGLTVTSNAANGSCTGSATPITVEVFPRPIAGMNADKWATSINFPGIQFFDQSLVGGSGQINYWEWQFGDPNMGMSYVQNPYYQYPVVNPLDTASYRVNLLVRTTDDCWDTTSRVIQLIPELSVFIPNAFTPNREGERVNEKFVVVAGNYKNITIKLFNRWGELVFLSNDANVSWDGTYKGVPAQQDVYMYLVDVESIEGKVYQYSGTVTLLR